MPQRQSQKLYTDFGSVVLSKQKISYDEAKDICMLNSTGEDVKDGEPDTNSIEKVKKKYQFFFFFFLNWTI